MFKYRKYSIGSALLLLFTLWACAPAERQPPYIEGQVVRLDSIQVPQPDTETDSIIAIYREALEAEMNQVLAHSTQHMTKASPEGLLNNFIADLILEEGNLEYAPEDGHTIDFCLLNYGGLRTSIPEGPVTRSRIFELMPFENEMVVITLSGEKTRELFQYLAGNSGGMPVSAVYLEIKNRQPHHVMINGDAFDADRTYKVLTSDYLAGGGDGMNFFLDPLNSEPLGLKIRDAIIRHIETKNLEGKQLSSQMDGRITIVE